MSDIPYALRTFLESVNHDEEVNYTPSIVRNASATLSHTFGLPKVPVAFVIDYDVRLTTHDIPVRCYHPMPAKKLPVIFYYHGGGHLSCSLETHDRICRRITNATQCVVISLGYRLAPEFPYPCGVDDCIAITAGRNLALTVCHQLQQQNDSATQGLLLFYPAVDFSMHYGSYERNGRGFLLTKNKIIWYFNHYFAKVGGS